MAGATSLQQWELVCCQPNHLANISISLKEIGKVRMVQGHATNPNSQKDKELQTSMSPSSIFCAPLAEFHGRVPDPKQGMFRKSTECTYINVDHIPHTNKALI